MFGKKIAAVLLAILCFTVASVPVCTAAAGKTLIKINASYNPKAFGDMPLVIITQKFKEMMEERFPGKVEVRIYWDQRLAATYDGALNSLQTNVFHISFFPLTSMAEYTGAAVPTSNLFLFPYPHTQIAYDAYDGEVGELIRNRIIKDARVRPVAYLEMGFRHLLNNMKPVNTIEDLKGMKFRVQPNPVHLASFKELGANPTPIPWAELFTALQQGVVDGTENPFENIYTARLYEVQKYLTLSGHAFEMGIYAMGEEFYQSMPEDVRQGFDEIMAELVAEFRESMIAKNEEMLAFFKTQIEVNELSSEELARFRKAVEPAKEISRQQAGAEYADQLFSLLAKYEEEYFARQK